MGQESERPAYSERDAAESEEERGRVLTALAGGEVWIFITADEEKALAGDLDIKVDCGGLIDPKTAKTILTRLAKALP